MTQSLKDQLLGLGFAPKAAEPVAARPQSNRNAPRPDEGARKPQRPQERRRNAPRDAPGPGRPAPPGKGAALRSTPGNRGPAARAEIDLGRAYALRAQRDKDERIEAERERQEVARRKREAKARVLEMVAGKSLNDPAAEIARHFDYNGRIRRVHVTTEQLRALNAGELGVVQLDGRYLLFDADTVAAVREQLPGVIALTVDPAAEVQDAYADQRFAVPDDLVW